MPGTSELVERLRDAERSQHPSRIARDDLGVDPLYGFVVSVTEEWTALQTLSDAVYVDGYDVLRTSDITHVDADRSRPYIERALAELGRPEVDFQLQVGATTADVLAAAAAHSTLVTVHFEQDEGEPCWVGHLDRLDATKFRLQFIDPNGQWETERWQIEYQEVTRVEFGDRYSLALTRYGDPRPTD